MIPNTALGSDDPGDGSPAPALVPFREAVDAILTVDDDGLCVDANPAACALYGRPAGELIGSAPTAFGPAPDAEAWARLLGGADAAGHVSICRPDGSACPADISSLGTYAPGRLAVLVRDAGERLDEESAARVAMELIENLPLGTYILSFSDHVKTYISPVGARMLGYPIEAWNDPAFIEQTIHPDDRAEMMENIERMLSGEIDSDAREYRLLAADGRVLWAYGAVDMIRSPDGAPLYQRGYHIDITEQKELEEQLHQSQRMETIGQLAGGIAHDFNNLLTAITGYSSFALERAGDADPHLQHDLEQVVRSADRAASLTQQLLAFSRRQVLQPRTLDLNEVIDEVHSLLVRLLGEHVDLVTQRTEAPLLVRADPGRLEQVLVNLAVNARDAMTGGGTLSIRATESEIDSAHRIVGWGAEPGRYPTLVIEDTGSGMDEETLKHIFEPFFTTKDVGQGTGLGLSTVYGIVKQSGGWIAFDSSEGEGTTATIYLPAAPAVAAEPASEALRAARPGSGRILLVEDEDVVRTLVAQMLEQHGYEVVEAPGPHEALKLTDGTDRCELLLTDVVMPKMNGRELARRIRVQDPDLHVVYTSGYAPEAVLDGGRLDEGEFFLQKPFTATDLAAIVAEALDAARTRVQ